MKIITKSKIGSVPTVPNATGPAYKRDPSNKTVAILHAYTLAIKLKKPMVVVPNNNKGHNIYQIAHTTDSLFKFGIVIPSGETMTLNMVDERGIVYKITAR